MRLRRDPDKNKNDYVGSLYHRVIMFLVSLTFLMILIRVIIVAAPGYDFHTSFTESEILTKRDSLIIRGASALCALPLLFLTPAFWISIHNEDFAKKLFAFLNRLIP
ncbi:MAG: hypothetical protein HKO02_04475 [Hyphomonadaceae bacterium]|nr:hypothetical protein [Hyphomonadaceae bacterium]